MIPRATGSTSEAIYESMLCHLLDIKQDTLAGLPHALVVRMREHLDEPDEVMAIWREYWQGQLRPAESMHPYDVWREVRQILAKR